MVLILICDLWITMFNRSVYYLNYLRMRLYLKLSMRFYKQLIDLSLTFMNLTFVLVTIYVYYMNCLECLTGLLLLCYDLNYDIISFILYWHKFLTSLWMSYLNLCSHCRMVWVFWNLCYERHIIFWLMRPVCYMYIYKLTCLPTTEGNLPGFLSCWIIYIIYSRFSRNWT